jgi:hypothetical protein
MQDQLAHKPYCKPVFADTGAFAGGLVVKYTDIKVKADKYTELMVTEIDNALSGSCGCKYGEGN